MVGRAIGYKRAPFTRLSNSIKRARSSRPSDIRNARKTTSGVHFFFISMAIILALILLILQVLTIALLVAEPLVFDDGHVPEPVGREYCVAVVALVPAGQLVHWFLLVDNLVLNYEPSVSDSNGGCAQLIAYITRCATAGTIAFPYAFNASLRHLA